MIVIRIPSIIIDSAREHYIGLKMSKRPCASRLTPRVFFAPMGDATKNQVEGKSDTYTSLIEKGVMLK